MRILHVVRGMTNSSGTTHIVKSLSEAQARLGCQVTMLYVDKPPHVPVLPDPDLVEAHGFPLSLPLSNPGVSWSFARALPSFVRDSDIVHIHAIWNFPTCCSMWRALRQRIPYVVAPQGSFDPWALRRNPWGKRLYGGLTEIPLLQRASLLQAVTEKEREQFLRYGLRTPVRVIPNGVNMEDLDVPRAPLHDRFGLEPGQLTVLFLSRIHPKKGLETLIDAFGMLVQRLSNVTLVIAGSDAGSGYASTIRARASAAGLGARCIFLGEVGGPDKASLLRGADLFVLPSHSEGLPVAVIEAMAAGCPVVVSSECNLPEVATVGAGLVVEGGVADYRQAMESMLNDRDRCQLAGERARLLVQNRFQWPMIARELVDVYRNLPPSGNAVPGIHCG